MKNAWRNNFLPFASAILLISTAAWAYPAKFGLAPDNNLNLLLSVLEEAKKTLTINIYQFESKPVADALIKRIRAGVQVRLLIEGSPVRGMTPEGKKILNRIHQAMTQSSNPSNRIFIMTKLGSNGKRRFRFDHAKYVIADSQTVLMSSENFSPKGHPVSGETGNRGWEVVLQDASLAAQLNSIFTSDSNPSAGDILVVEPEDDIPYQRIEGDRDGFQPVSDQPSEPLPRMAPAFSAGKGDITRATLITSPNSQDALVNLLRSASQHIEVEQMSFPSTWRFPGNVVVQNPLVTELIQAARRGVTVRALLNDDRVFDPDPTDDELRPSQITAQLLQTIARCYHLPLEAKIVDIEKVGISYIHNKGVLVDGAKALVSSINGTRNSITFNRETAVLLESTDAAAYFGKAFSFDWTKSPAYPVQEGTACPSLPDSNPQPFSQNQPAEYFLLPLHGY